MFLFFVDTVGALHNVIFLSFVYKGINKSLENTLKTINFDCVFITEGTFWNGNLEKTSIIPHSSFEQEKTVNEFLLGLWICFRAYGWLLSWPRWKFLLWKYCNQVALQSFFQKVTEIKNKKNFSLKKPFVTPNFWCRNFSRMHHFWVWIFLSPRINE